MRGFGWLGRLGCFAKCQYRSEVSWVGDAVTCGGEPVHAAGLGRESMNRVPFVERTGKTGAKQVGRA